MSPAWCANDNSVLDGHHRLGKALAKQKPFKAFQIDLNPNDAPSKIMSYRCSILDQSGKFHNLNVNSMVFTIE